MIRVMKAVILDIPQEVIDRRRRLGLDRWDEVWEGVYHMAPPPDEEHQVVTDSLFGTLWSYILRHKLGVIRSNKAIRDMRHPEQDYRIPEWIFFRSGRESMLKGGWYVEEGPDAALEVVSPGDETDEKIPFYEKMGLGEMLRVERDSRRVQVLRLVAGRLTPVSPNADGWVYSEALRAFFRTDVSSAKPAVRVLLELDRTEHAF